MIEEFDEVPDHRPLPGFNPWVVPDLTRPRVVVDPVERSQRARNAAIALWAQKRKGPPHEFICVGCGKKCRTFNTYWQKSRWCGDSCKHRTSRRLAREQAR